MPILTIQRRLRESGRIRLGDSVQATSKAGKAYARPRKLNTFRLTSPDQQLLEQAAELYGGTVTPWDGHDGQFDLTTNATVLPCRIPPAAVAFSQWFEHWSGGLCEQRCDGEWDVLRDCACTCDPSAPLCKPVTRLTLLLTDLPGSGAWRLESRGWNAATELATTVELIHAASERGIMLPARLLLVQRQGVYRDDKGKPITRKFVVPALDIDATMFGSTAIAAAPLALTELEDAVQPGLTPVSPRALEQAEQAAPSIAEQAAPKAPKARRSNAAAPIGGTGVKPRTAAERAGDPSVEGTGAGTVSEAPADGAGSAPTEPSSGEVPVSHPAQGTLPEPDPDAVARAGKVAMWCRDAGITDDDERHRFLLAFSEGRYSSGKDAPPDDLAGIRAATVKLRRGDLHLDTGQAGQPILIDSTLGIMTTKAGSE